MTDSATCASPFCSRPLVRAATGRRAKYCCPTCRVQAHRERERLEAEAEEREVELYAARSNAAAMWRELEPARYDVSDASGEAFRAVSDDETAAEDAEDAIVKFERAAALYAELARGYRAAVGRATEIEKAEETARELAGLRDRLNPPATR